MGRTCGEPDEIKKNTHPKNITALFRDQDRRLISSLGLECRVLHGGKIEPGELKAFLKVAAKA